MMTIKQVFDLSTNDSFLLCFDQFLDDFAKASIAQKEAAVRDEPIMRDRFAKNRYCMAAASVEMIAKQAGFPAPDWVYDEKYTLKRPYYEFNTTLEAYRELLREVSPDEFRQRNMFVYPNVISRI